MTKRKNKQQVVGSLIEQSEYSGWCVVNIHNEFIFNGDQFTINEAVKQYKVKNKPMRSKISKQWNNWENEAQMISILVVDNGEYLRFFDEKLKEVPTEFVTMS